MDDEPTEADKVELVSVVLALKVFPISRLQLTRTAALNSTTKKHPTVLRTGHLFLMA
jgi:hypothetical protein